MRDFFLSRIYNPRVPIDAHEYSPYGALGWELPSDPKWTKPMGEQLCIIDLDNRPFDEPGQVFGPGLMSWDKAKEVRGQSLGVLNHWLYDMTMNLHAHRNLRSALVLLGSFELAC